MGTARRRNDSCSWGRKGGPRRHAPPCAIVVWHVAAAVAGKRSPTLLAGLGFARLRFARLRFARLGYARLGYARQLFGFLLFAICAGAPGAAWAISAGCAAVNAGGFNITANGFPGSPGDVGGGPISGFAAGDALSFTITVT